MGRKITKSATNQSCMLHVAHFLEVTDAPLCVAVPGLQSGGGAGEGDGDGGDQEDTTGQWQSCIRYTHFLRNISKTSLQGEVILTEAPVVVVDRRLGEEERAASILDQVSQLGPGDTARVTSLHDPEPGADPGLRAVRVFRANSIESRWRSATLGKLLPWLSFRA